LFAKFTDDKRARDKEYLYQFCSFIAEELNKQLQSNQCVAVRRKSFIEGLTGVWSDVKDDKLQPLHLIRQLHDHIDTNFGCNNLPICYTYWR
jgi:hypothetical protein